MSRDRTKWQEEQLESHGIFLNLDQIGYTEIHKCNEMATHYYEFIFCRTGNTNDNKMITACQSHSLEIENYIWRVSAIGLNMLQYIDEQLSTEELKWADSAYERGFISSFLKISPIVEDSFRDGLRKRFGLRSNEIEKSMYDRYLDSDGNLHCRNVYMRRSVSNQFNLLFQPLFKRNLDKLLKKPKDTAPDGYVLDIIKGSIPETTELFRSHLPMK